MQTIIGQTRANDSNKLKEKIIDILRYFNLIAKDSAVVEQRQDKTARGLRNIDIARLLTPYQYIEQLDEDPHE
jgi:hypothetical protein